MAAQDMGLGGAGAGAAAYQVFQDMLARRFAEEQFQQKVAESQAQNGLEQQRINQQGRQFDATNSRLGGEFNTTEGRLNSQFAAGGPQRAANVANTQEETASSIDKRSPETRMHDLQDKQTLARTEGAIQAGLESQKEKFQSQQPVSFINQTDGSPVMMRINPDNTTTPIQLPAGLAPKNGMGKLSPPQQNEAANYDAVIREGQNIMQQLKTSGLDKDNNILDARSRNFIANKLKVSSNDPAVDKMMQNIGYLQTVALRSAAGNQRLTNYVAEVFKPHIGDTETTGSKLATIIPELMRETTARRADLYKIARVPDPSAKVGPTNNDPLGIR